jgi:hypothetical protein
MDAQMIALVIAGAGALGVVVWMLAKLGKALIKIAEALAAAAAVLFALRLLIKAIVWALHQVLTHWRTSLALVALGAWWHWWGWASLALATAWSPECSPDGDWPTWRPSTRGQVGTCARGGCAGRSTPRNCLSGCTPAA